MVAAKELQQSQPPLHDNVFELSLHSMPERRDRFRLFELLLLVNGLLSPFSLDLGPKCALWRLGLFCSETVLTFSQI